MTELNGSEESPIVDNDTGQQDVPAGADDRTIFDDAPPGAARKTSPPPLDPQLAEQYREAARALALEGEDALAKRLKPQEDDSRLLECRSFLQALSAARGDGLPILFGAMMREAVVSAHATHGARPRARRCPFPQTLFGSRTGFEEACQQRRRASLCKSFSVTPGRDGDFPGLPTVMGRLLVLNALGYDVHVAANGMLFSHRCRMTCPWVRILVVELDHATMGEQDRLLDAIRPTVAAAVFSGRRSVHLFIPLSRPVRNPHCVRASDWRQLRALKASGGLDRSFRVPGAELAADALRRIVVDASGREPDPKVLRNFACLTRAPGFRHGETGGLSRLLHADPTAKWGNPNGLPALEDDSPATLAVWQEIGDDWEGRHGGGGSDHGTASPAGRALSSSTMGRDARGTRQGSLVPGVRVGGGDAEDMAPETQCRGDGTGDRNSARLDPPSRSPAPPVLSIDDTGIFSGMPARTFFDDMDGLEGLLRAGIPGRHRRLKSHAVLLNAARILGWLPRDATGDGGWTDAKARLMGAWGRIVGKTPEGNIGMTTDEAIEDFSRHLDAVAGDAGVRRFRPRMPDFGTLPELGDAPAVRAAARRVRRRLIGLAESGVLPAPDGGVRDARHVASGASRIIVELLWPLARQVPWQCLNGKASVQAARLRAMCPGRRGVPVVRWLAKANILRATSMDYLRPGGGCKGRTRPYFVNLPLMAWLAGARKEGLSWAARRRTAGGSRR